VKSAALTARTREVSASVKKLKKLGTGKSEMENRKSQVSATMSSQVEQSSRRVVAFEDTLEPETQQINRLSSVLRSTLEIEATSHSDDTTKDTLEPETDKASGPLSDPARSSVLNSVRLNGDQNSNFIDFDWNKFIDHARQDYIAIHSVLSKCDHEIDGDTLVLYTKNRFYKNKLDEPKHAVLISKCLNEVGVFGLTIHTIPTAVPPTNAYAAAIVAIMGGGEEVAFDLA